MAETNTDLIIPPGFYAFVMDTSKGEVRTEVGPYKVGISNTDRPVKFDPKTGRFDRVDNPENAVMPFIRATENDYVVLDSPAKEARQEHPTPGKSNSLAELAEGKQIVIAGPIAFAQWPGQKAKVIGGHKLKSNQYLFVEVTNPEEAKNHWDKQMLRAAKKPVVTNTGGDGTQDQHPDQATDQPQNAPPPDVSLSEINPADLVIGQRLVIKGTAASFYMPVTGLVVVQESEGKYVREAVTLERMQYCRLISESGTERIEIGPKVVFPEADETFTKRSDAKGDDDSRVFQAIELNEQMGLYLKVTADYDEGDKHFSAGDELFITGKDTRIYYPRPEHSIVKYGGKDRIYAVTVPVGKGYYLLDKREGKIKTVYGPCLLLPDPRFEVIVRRVLDSRTVNLYFPGNNEALAYNRSLQSLLGESGGPGGFVSEALARGLSPTAESFGESDLRMRSAVRSKEIGASSFDRGTEYTPPRSITLDDKFGGAVAITVWPGFAVQVVSKDGSSRIVKGYGHTLLEFDETLSELTFSTGTPKSDDNTQQTPYLRISNNRVSDRVTAETGDMVKVQLSVAYQVNFEGEDGSRWFVVSDYVQLLAERMRSVIRAAVKEVGIEELIARAAALVRDAVLGHKPEDGGKRSGYTFEENAMRVTDLEVLDTSIPDRSVATLLLDNQQEAMRLALEVSQQESKREATGRLEAAKRAIAELTQDTTLAGLELAIARLEKEGEKATRELELRHERDKLVSDNALVIATSTEAVAVVKRETERLDNETELAASKATQELELERLGAEVEAAVMKITAISPDLIQAITSVTDKDVAVRLSSALAPIALLQGTGVNEVLAGFLKDSALGQVFSKAFGVANTHANNGHVKELTD